MSVVERRRPSAAGSPNHPGRAHRRHPLPGRDMRDVPIPTPPGPPPPGEMGTRMVWAPWAAERGQWQVFCAPCPLCDVMAPVVFPHRMCLRCVALLGLLPPS